MKKSLLLSLGLMLFGLQSYAQDVIHVFDQRPIEAKVLEITDDYVRYKTFDNLEGPDYRMSVARIMRIVFENGTEKTFSSAAMLAAPNFYGPVRYRLGRFYDYRGIPVDNYSDMIGAALYGSDYRKARNRTFWGISLTGLGSALVVASMLSSSMTADFNHSSGMNISSDSATIFGVMGGACLVAGIPLWISGSRKFNKIADDYNKNYGRGNVGHNSSLQLKSGVNGVGLAFCF